MVEALLSPLGPLAFPECRRASRRSYLIWLRMLPAVVAGFIVFTTLLAGRFRAIFDPHHGLDDDIRALLGLILGGASILVLILAPALLAGSLAGEKERGSIALLLSTEASARDIVLSRWVGRLAPLGLTLAVAIPFLVPLLALGNFPASSWLLTFLLPIALGLGSGGFALAVSALSKRGRDALLMIYLLDIGALIASMFGARTGMAEWLVLALDPLLAIGPLVERGEVGPALAVAAGWSGLGALSLTIASWRLRPSCLTDPAQRPGRARRGTRRRVPPVGERPMLWKELYIDRAGSLGRVGRWLGGLITLCLGLGSVLLAIVALGGVTPWVGRSAGGSFDVRWATEALGLFYGSTTVAIGFLIQWSIGLRSSVMVASERERGTWDGLLTSPLTPAEIVTGKLGGSWFALRWLVGSALVAWTLTALLGEMTLYRYALSLAETLVWGTLMAGFGLAMSLRTSTATRAMAVTVGGWCSLFVAAKMVAAFLTLISLGIVAYFLRPTGVAWLNYWLPIGIDWGALAVTALITGLVLADTFARFDRIAGRAAGGATAAAIDQLIYGRPMAPVQLDAAR